MPIFDTPITANDASLERVLAQTLPLLVYFYQQPDDSINQALERSASTEAGKLLVVRIDASQNPRAYERLGRPTLPAIMTLQDGQVKSQAAPAYAADVEAHASYALGRGPKPSEGRSQASTNSAGAGSAKTAPIHVNDSGFSNEVLNSDLPVLVDFWAPWCGPCHMVAPLLDRLAQQYAGQIKIAKVNVDENPNLSGRYQVTGIPQLLMFKSGKVVGKLVGAHPQGNIEQLIKQALH